MSGIPYNAFEVILSYDFKRWVEKQSNRTKNLIQIRINHLSEGHFGNHKRFEGLIELRWVNGMRIYCCLFNTQIIVLFGGYKNGQIWDIKKAKKIKAEIVNGTRSLQ